MGESCVWGKKNWLCLFLEEQAKKPKTAASFQYKRGVGAYKRIKGD
jgi:hypothetical protein